jgi:hypothetical protein
MSTTGLRRRSGLKIFNKAYTRPYNDDPLIFQEHHDGNTSSTSYILFPLNLFPSPHVSSPQARSVSLL